MTAIEGVAVDEDGDPLPNTLVYLINGGTSEIAEIGKTDSDGFFRFTGQTGYSTTDTFHVAAFHEQNGTVRQGFTKPEVNPAESHFFDVTITATNGPVPPGNDLVIDYEVENTGSETAEDDVELLVSEADGPVDNDTWKLAPDDVVSSSLVWSGASEISGFVDVDVVGDSTATETVLVEDEEAFKVEITGSNNPVDVGETLNVDYKVTNVAQDSGTQDIIFEVDGTEVDRDQDITLSYEESTTGTLSWSSTDTKGRDFSAVVKSVDDTAELSVDVLGPDMAYFSVDIVGTNEDGVNEAVIEGETLEVTADITNDGNATASQEISLGGTDIFGSSTTLSIDSGVTKTTTLTWDTSDGDGGDGEQKYTAKVESSNDSDDQEIAIQDAFVEYHITSSVSTNSPVVAGTDGDPLQFTVPIENKGNVKGGFDDEVSVSIDEINSEESLASKNPEIAAGASQDVVLEWSPEWDDQNNTGDVGQFEALVETSSTDPEFSDSTTVNVEVLEPVVEYKPTITGTNEPVVESNVLDITIDVESIGTVSGSQDLKLWILNENTDPSTVSHSDSSPIDSTSINVEVETTATKTLSWDTETGDFDDWTALVTTQDARDTQLVTIDPSDESTPSDSAPDDVCVVYNEMKRDDEGRLKIWDDQELQAMACQDDDFIIMRDIDASATDQWYNDDGFSPIQNFTGTLDGQEYTVKGLTIDRDRPNSGLFASTKDATIESVLLENVSITDTDANTGALVGLAQNTRITNCSIRNGSVSVTTGTAGGMVGKMTESRLQQSSSTATVTTNIDNNGKAGGLVGILTDDSNVKKCYTSSTVESNWAGGLVGLIDRASKIGQSYTEGTVNCGFIGGGIAAKAGENNIGTITFSSCFSQCDINGQESGSDAGGIVAELDADKNKNQGYVVIYESYAATPIDADDFKGGLIAISYDTEYTVVKSYWDGDVGPNNTVGGGTQLTTSEMKGGEASSNMTFDFTDRWYEIDSGSTTYRVDDYPRLQWAESEFDVTITDYYVDNS